MYRFARTYGFVSYRASTGAANRHAGPKDTLSVQVGASHPPTPARKRSTNDQRAGATQGGGPTVGTVEGAPESQPERLQLELPVSLGDVGDAVLAGTGNHAVPNNSDGARAVCEALEARLRRYSTSLEQDLAGLSADSSSEAVGDAAGVRCVGEGAGGCEDAAGNRDRDGASSEWVELCVRVRAAEKLALRRALREASTRLVE